jgi:hypothetical protein
MKDWVEKSARAARSLPGHFRSGSGVDQPFGERRILHAYCMLFNEGQLPFVAV